jgi:hypothetical protein
LEIQKAGITIKKYPKKVAFIKSKGKLEMIVVPITLARNGKGAIHSNNLFGFSL